MNTTATESTVEWARAEFGSANLGNKLRTERLVAMASRAAERPAGKLTAVFENGAEREAAYRFVENVHVSYRDVARGAWMATVDRAGTEDVVCIAVDGSSITLTDRVGSKNHGRMSNVKDKARGAQVMTALAMNQSGVPIGVASQCWWYRPDKPVSTPAKKRTVWEKESRYWLDVIRLSEEQFVNAASSARRWYQCDAGADFRELLRQAADSDQWYTIRAAQDRLTADGDGEHLWAAVEATPLSGTFDLEVPAGRSRKARTALIEVRFQRVSIRPRHALKGTRAPFELWAVHAREQGTTPAEEAPIEWMLLTNHAVHSFCDAQVVIRRYGLRWRVEEFHKTWKSVCRIEESQLEQSAFQVWAAILASVAVRAERLKRLARETPAAPAAEFFSAAELEALVLLRQPKALDAERPIELGQAVRWLADIGGYTGNSRSGPPGSIVLGRGLARLEPAAMVLSRGTRK